MFSHRFFAHETQFLKSWEVAVASRLNFKSNFIQGPTVAPLGLLVILTSTVVINGILAHKFTRIALNRLPLAPSQIVLPKSYKADSRMDSIFIGT